METVKDMGKFVVVVVLAILFASFVSSCATSDIGQRFENLLFQEEHGNTAYKSITIKDYEEEDYCG
jgi:hypothetical protein